MPPVAYAVAYGSAVMKQAGYQGSGMVDYIVAVDDAAEWHRQNLQQNGGAHYSFLRVLGARALARTHARTHTHTEVTTAEGSVKSKRARLRASMSWEKRVCEAACSPGMETCPASWRARRAGA